MDAGVPALSVLFPVLVCVQVLALVVDALYGEPERFHPLAGFGILASRVEARLNSGNRPRLHGGVAWAVLVVLPTLVLSMVLYLLWQWNQWLFWITNLLVLYLTLGLKSLAEHASWVTEPLASGDLETARRTVSWLVSRDTGDMDEKQIIKACIESILENGNDAVFGALLWFLVAGAPGALAFRLSNTLDACWGHRSERLREFGCVAARADDVLAYVPARVCAFCYALVGSQKNALAAWRQTSRWRRTPEAVHASPNAGIVMSSGAGALRVSLGGEAFYAGVSMVKPPLGLGGRPDIHVIGQSIRLLRCAVVLWIIVQSVLYAGLMWSTL